MLENRHINLIIITLMTVAIVFTSIFVISPQSLGISSSLSDEVEYASLLFNKDEVAEINIEMEKEDWDWIIENATDEEYRSADITINGETFYNIGIRPKGNSSLRAVAQDDTSDRYSFKIKFDQYIEGQNYYGLDELVLNNMMSDATYMKEYLSYDLFERMGIVTPLYSFSNININSEPWGLYLSVEATEESFLNRSFGSNYGNLYKPESGGSDLKWVDDNPSSYQGIKDNAQTKITDEDFDKVVEMIRNLNSGTDLGKYLDVDEVLRYFAVNTLLVNQDSYVGNFYHNYLLYEENGIFSILPWDLNMSFAGFQSRSSQQSVDLSIDTPYSGSPENYPLISKLLEVDEYKDLYHQYLEEATNLYFDSGLFEETIDKLDNLIDEYVENDTTAFYTYEEYTASLPVLKEFGKLRANSVHAQLSGESSAGTVDLDLNALGSMGGGPGGENRPNNMGEAENRNMQNGMEGRVPPADGENPPGFDNQGNRQNNPNGARPDRLNNRNMGNMMNQENMEAIMEIIQEVNGGELTESQINKLKELGLDEATIENFKGGNPVMGGGFPREGMGRDGERMDFNNSRNPIPTLIIAGISLLVMLVALLLVKRFRRYKYVKGSKNI